MKESIRFNYDNELNQYMLYVKSASDHTEGAEPVFMPVNGMDKNLDNSINKLADTIERIHDFEEEKMKFLLMHKDNDNVAPELSKYNQEYLASLDKLINEAKKQERSTKNEIVDNLETLLNISIDPVSKFFFSFLSETAKSSDKKIDFNFLNNSSQGPKSDYQKFDKHKHAVGNLNVLDICNQEVKIILTEKDNRESVKIITDKEAWDNIARDLEYQRMLTDKETYTRVYTLSKEKFAEIEKGLKESTSAQDFLDAKLGGPVAVKEKGVEAECMEVEQKIHVDNTIENQLSRYFKDLDEIKKDGRFEKLQNGEKISILKDNGNISVDVCKGIGKNDTETILFGNIQVKDEDKISPEARLRLSKIKECHIIPFKEGNKQRWISVTPNCIPDKIKGHVISKEEKKALLKGETVTCSDCRESVGKEYEASLNLRVEKTPLGIKPVIKVAPTISEQKQNLKNDLEI